LGLQTDDIAKNPLEDTKVFAKTQKIVQTVKMLSSSIKATDTTRDNVSVFNDVFDAVATTLKDNDLNVSHVVDTIQKQDTTVKIPEQVEQVVQSYVDVVEDKYNDVTNIDTLDDVQRGLASYDYNLTTTIKAISSDTNDTNNSVQVDDLIKLVEDKNVSNIIEESLNHKSVVIKTVVVKRDDQNITDQNIATKCGSVGGIAVYSGIDTNGNNILDDGEKNDNPQIVCNGEAGPQGNDGKSAYQIWLDEGHSGDESAFLDSLKGSNGIDGTNGYTSLIKTNILPTNSTECATGGVQLLFGIDLNYDGNLSTNEITQTVSLCNGNSSDTTTTTSSDTVFAQTATLKGTVPPLSKTSSLRDLRQMTSMSGGLWLTPAKIEAAIAQDQATSSTTAKTVPKPVIKPIPITVDDNGSYELKNIPSGNDYSLVYISDEGNSTKVKNISLTPGSVVVKNIQTIDLTNPGDLNVTVYSSATTTPLENAIVRINDLDRDVNTSADGSATFHNIPVGVYSVSVYKDNYLSQYGTFKIDENQTTSMNIELTTVKGKLSGNVKASGVDDYSNIIVYAQGIDGSLYTTLTNSSGNYIFNALPVGTGYSVVAYAHDYQSEKIDNINILQNLTSVAPTIMLTKYPTVSISRSISRDLRDVQVEGIDVGSIAGYARFADVNDSFKHAGIIVSLEGTDYEAITSRDGSFILNNIPDGNYTINFSDSNHVTVTKENVEVVAAATVHMLDIKLEPKVGAIEGTVQNDNNQIVSNAIVTISNNYHTYTTTTNSDGNFTKTDIVAGNYDVIVSKDGFGVAKSTVEVKNGTSVDVAPITMQRFILTGTLQLEGSTDSSGASIILLGSDTAPTTSDNNGHFTIYNIQKGSYQLQISKTGYITQQIPITIASDDGVAINYTIVLKKAKGTLSGIVNLDGSIDNSGVNVNIDGIGTVTTDYSGRWSIDLPVNQYTSTVTYTKANYQTVSYNNGFEINASQTTSLDHINMSLNVGTITGKVLDDKNNTLEGVNVALVSGINSYSVETNSTGEFTKNIAVGTYTVSAMKTGYGYAQSTITIAYNEVNDTLSSNPLQLVSNTIKGIVNIEDTNNSDFSGVTVKLTNLSDSSISNGVIDSNGAFTISAVKAGNYKLDISYDNDDYINQTMELYNIDDDGYIFAMPITLHKKAIARDYDILTFNYIKGQNTDENNTKYNLFLPTVLPNGSTVLWSSDNADLVSNSGLVNLPLSSESNTLNLTATISYSGETSKTKIFPLTVVQDYQPRFISSDSNITVDEDFGYLFKTITATNANNEPIQYTLTNVVNGNLVDNFKIDSSTGELSLKSKSNANGIVTADIIAHSGTPELNATKHLIINITPVADPISFDLPSNMVVSDLEQNSSKSLRSRDENIIDINVSNLINSDSDTVYTWTISKPADSNASFIIAKDASFFASMTDDDWAVFRDVFDDDFSHLKTDIIYNGVEYNETTIRLDNNTTVLISDYEEFLYTIQATNISIPSSFPSYFTVHTFDDTNLSKYYDINISLDDKFSNLLNNVSFETDKVGDYNITLSGSNSDYNYTKTTQINVVPTAYLDDQGNIVFVAEGEEATFTIHLSSAYDKNVTVDVKTIEGSAKEGKDFVPVDKTVTFLPGETEKQIKVYIINDDIPDSIERFYVEISNPSNAILATEYNYLYYGELRTVKYNTQMAQINISFDGLHPKFSTANLNGKSGFVIDGRDTNESFGSSVSGAGDINGDGYDDIIVGSKNGSAYIFYGDQYMGVNGYIANENNDSLGLKGFVIDDSTISDFPGRSVSKAGDMNKDGYDDLLICGTNKAMILWGSPSYKTSAQDINKTVITDINDKDTSFESCAYAGDMNGDGYDDIAITSANDEKVSVIFGSSLIPADINVSDLGSSGITLTTNDSGIGFSLYGGSDVNNDGYDDLVVSGVEDQNNSYIFFGSSTLTNTDISSILKVNFTTSEHLYYYPEKLKSIATGGDVNGDGIDDIVFSDNNILYGSKYLPKTGTVISTLHSFAYDSNSIAILKDIDGDGIDEIGLVQPTWNNSTHDNVATIDYGDSNLSNVGKFNFGVNFHADDLLTMIQSAGDLNGDGYYDMVFSTNGYNSNTGRVYVVFGGNYRDKVKIEGLNDDNVLNGTTEADTIVAGNGNDIINTNGGADIIKGGNGDDNIILVDNNAKLIDGGRGHDTISLNASGVILDMSSSSTTKIMNIESINISGTGSNTLKIDRKTLLHLGSNLVNGITIIGNADDRITFTDDGWSLNSSNDLYNIYSNNGVVLFVHKNIPEIPTITFDNSAKTIYENDGYFELTMNRSNIQSTSSFDYSFGQDSGTMHFYQYEKSKTFKFPIVIDNKFKNDENLTFEITSFNNAFFPTKTIALTKDDKTINIPYDVEKPNMVKIYNSAASKTFSIGDFTGDGTDDIVNSSMYGWVDIVYGENIGDKDTIDGSHYEANGVRVRVPDNHCGISVLGDINQDGYSDFGISDYDNNTTYIIYGGSSELGDGSDLDLSDNNLDRVVKIRGINSDFDSSYYHGGIALGNFGIGTAANDIVLSSNEHNGTVYIVDSNLSSGEYNITDLVDNNQAIRFYGSDNEYLGASLSTNNDFDNDGHNDIIIGTANSKAYVILNDGNLTNLDTKVIDDENDNSDNIIEITDITNEAGHYINVSFVGNVDNDDYGDALVSSYEDNSTGIAKSGKTYVLYGTNSADDVNLSDYNSTQALAIHGTRENETLGLTLGNVGDFDDDNITDIAIGSYLAFCNVTLYDTCRRGVVDVIYGKVIKQYKDNDIKDINLTKDVFDYGNGINGGIIIQGTKYEVEAGTTINSGDINNDGYDDIIFGTDGNGYIIKGTSGN